MDMMIDVEDLTSFETAPDGATTCLTLRDKTGHDIAMVLPLACLTSLMATLQRMLTEARQRLYDDPSLRIVYPVDAHVVEHGDDAGSRIVTLVAGGTGRMSYRLSVDQCQDIGGAGASAASMPDPHRLN